MLAIDATLGRLTFQNLVRSREYSIPSIRAFRTLHEEKSLSFKGVFKLSNRSIPQASAHQFFRLGGLFSLTILAEMLCIAPGGFLSVVRR